MQAGGNCLVMQAQCRLDETGDTGRALGMTEVGLDRSHAGPRFRCASLGQNRTERTELDRIPGASTGSVRFDIADLARGDPSIPVSLAQQLLLTYTAGRPHGATAATIVVDRATANDRIDPIAGGPCRRKRFQYDEARTLAAHVTVTGCIAKLAPSIRCHHPALRVSHADVWLQDDIDATSQSKLTLTVSDTARRHMDGNERR